MKIFIWKRVDQCSDCYHSEGGVVVFSNTEEEARRMANAKDGCNIKEIEKPDHVRDVADGEAMVFIFEDAGCC